SQMLDGVLLVAWAGFVIWLADRRKSELLALFAVGLAYYTSIITDVGLFTLYSNVVLTAAAVFFLVRNRWAALSFLSLLATYGAFVFWRFFYNGDFLWDFRTGELTQGNLFLACYWVLFTAAVFLSRSDKLAGAHRVTFLSFNNGAFFGLVILSMFHVRTGSFWKLSLGYGTVLLAMSVLARRVLPQEGSTRNAYLTQGLVAVTAGLISYFSGSRL